MTMYQNREEYQQEQEELHRLETMINELEFILAKHFLTVKQTQDLLQVSRQTVYARASQESWEKIKYGALTYYRRANVEQSEINLNDWITMGEAQDLLETTEIAIIELAYERKIEVRELAGVAYINRGAIEEISFTKMGHWLSAEQIAFMVGLSSSDISALSKKLDWPTKYIRQKKYYSKPDVISYRNSLKKKAA